MSLLCFYHDVYISFQLDRHFGYITFQFSILVLLLCTTFLSPFHSKEKTTWLALAATAIVFPMRLFMLSYAVLTQLPFLVRLLFWLWARSQKIPNCCVKFPSESVISHCAVPACWYSTIRIRQISITFAFLVTFHWAEHFFTLYTGDAKMMSACFFMDIPFCRSGKRVYP